MSKVKNWFYSIVFIIILFSILVTMYFGIDFTVEFADELGFKDYQIIIFAISFIGTYLTLWSLLLYIGLKRI